MPNAKTVQSKTFSEYYAVNYVHAPNLEVANSQAFYFQFNMKRLDALKLRSIGKDCFYCCFCL